MKPRSINNVRPLTNDSKSLITGSVPPARGPQLELGFGASALAANGDGRPASAQPRRLSRAQWWFQRMRQIVDRARDWQPVPRPRPEQIWFPNAYRQPALAPVRASTQRQICE